MKFALAFVVVAFVLLVVLVGLLAKVLVPVGFAHGFHTPYWILRSVMHLPDADESRLVQLYRKFLIHITGSKLMDSVEKHVLNYVCPKSLILYAEKPA